MSVVMTTPPGPHQEPGRTDRREVTVPLSEHEQRVLEQMEQALYAEDPRFATSLVGKSEARQRRRRAALGLLIAIATMGVAFRAEAKREEVYPSRKDAPATVKVGIPLLIAAVILVTAVLPVALLGLLT